MTRPGKRLMAKMGIESRSAALEADALPLGQRGSYSGKNVLNQGVETDKEGCGIVKYGSR